MTSSLKSVVTLSLVNVVSNCAGILLALKYNLTSDLGGSLQGHDVTRDFLSTTGTALSAPVPFIVIQLVLIWLAMRNGRARAIGIAGLGFVGLLYTLAQAGERILLRLLSPGGFDLLQMLVFAINVLTAAAMLVLSIIAWRKGRSATPAPSPQA